MPSTDDERTPLLRSHTAPKPEIQDTFHNIPHNHHSHFCMLIGVPPSNVPPHAAPTAGIKTLYGRAIRQRAQQQFNYVFTATLSNVLLLSQVVLSAALTALGASESSHVLITIFGVLNTIIAGLVAYLKSRGQPMRARMYRDDLERVVDEIENSEIMWLGISKNVHGYDEVAVDDEVTVRSEVARLTRLYDKAVRTNTVNNPDMYMAGAAGEGGNVALRPRPGQAAVPPPGPAVSPVPGTAAQAPASAAAPAAAADVAPEDESPATAPPKEEKKAETAKTVGDKKESETSKDAASKTAKEKDPPAPVKPAADPDESPATASPKTTEKEVAKTDVSKPAAVEDKPDPDESPATAPPKHAAKHEPKEEDKVDGTEPEEDGTKSEEEAESKGKEKDAS